MGRFRKWSIRKGFVSKMFRFEHMFSQGSLQKGIVSTNIVSTFGLSENGSLHPWIVSTGCLSDQGSFRPGFVSNTVFFWNRFRIIQKSFKSGMASASNHFEQGYFHQCIVSTMDRFNNELFRPCVFSTMDGFIRVSVILAVFSTTGRFDHGSFQPWFV